MLHWLWLQPLAPCSQIMWATSQASVLLPHLLPKPVAELATSQLIFPFPPPRKASFAGWVCDGELRRKGHGTHLLWGETPQTFCAAMLTIESRYNRGHFQNWKWREQAGQRTFPASLGWYMWRWSRVCTYLLFLVSIKFSYFRYLEISQLRTPGFNTSSLLVPSTSPQSSFNQVHREVHNLFPNSQPALHGLAKQSGSA